MKATSGKTRVTVERVIAIEDGPVIQATYSVRSYRVETVVIRYEFDPEAFEFKADSRFQISLTGHWVKKDNTNGQAETTQRPEKSYATGKWTDEYNPWLPDLIEALRPSPDLTMTSLHRYEPEGWK